MTSSRNAVLWITEKLRQNGTDYQIVGGLAAIAHGATRELADIDLYIPFKHSQAFLKDLKPHIYWGPEHQKDEHWDITYLKINYEGQKIEIGDSDTAKIFDALTQSWISQDTDYGLSERKIVFGCDVNVMPLQQLLSYKKALNREVDLVDIKQITAIPSND